MGIGKDHAAAGQSIHVGSTCLGMTIQETNPVIEVIDRNEQDVGWRGCLDSFANQQAPQAGQQERQLLNPVHGSTCLSLETILIYMVRMSLYSSCLRRVNDLGSPEKSLDVLHNSSNFSILSALESFLPKQF